MCTMGFFSPRASAMYQNYPAAKPRPTPPSQNRLPSVGPVASSYPQQQMRNYREELGPSPSARSAYQKRAAPKPMVPYEEAWVDANVDFQHEHGRWTNDAYAGEGRYVRNATIDDDDDDDEPYVDQEPFLVSAYLSISYNFAIVLRYYYCIEYYCTTTTIVLYYYAIF